MTAAPKLDHRRQIIILASVIALIGASLAAALYNEREHKADVAASALVQARILAQTVTAALSFGDQAALRDYVAALKANAQIDEAGVYDTHGKLLASYATSKIADLSRPPKPEPGRTVVTVPIQENGERLGTVYLRIQGEPLERRLSRYVAPALLVVMASLMFVVTMLDAQVLRRANRALEAQIEEREKAENALRQSQKMEAIGRLTGGIAHDFNNILAIVLGSLELLTRQFPDVDAKLLRYVRQATEGAKRGASLTQRLLAFSRRQPLKPAPTDVNTAVREMMILLHRTLGEAVTVVMREGEGLWPAHIDLPQLETAIINLAANSRDAMPEGGKLIIETSNTYLDQHYTETEDDVLPGEYVMIAVSDTGLGIPEDVVGRVFEPFFTTKPTGQGTGLGLSQVYGFINQSGGHLRLHSEEGSGTTIKLYLPRSKTEVEQDALFTPSAGTRDRRKITVLVVEDEDGVRDFAVDALGELGYEVLAAEKAVTALALLDAHAEIDVLLTDVIMPETNGRVLAEEALRRRPDLRVVYMTGYSRDAIIHNGVLDPGTSLLSKPFTVSELETELERL